MKHFLVEITYTASLEAINAVLERHRAFLQKGYDAGVILMSGPQNPRTGGIVIARASSQETLKAFFAQDPFALEGVGQYRIVEFQPVKHAAMLADWVAGK